MKFTLCIIALTIMVSVEAVPAPATSPIVLPDNEKDYFTEGLKSVQGAIRDTLKAAQDLQTMETRLQDIVNLSSYFFRTESVTEYAVDADAYANDWKPAPKDDDEKAKEYWGRSGCNWYNNERNKERCRQDSKMLFDDSGDSAYVMGYEVCAVSCGAVEGSTGEGEPCGTDMECKYGSYCSPEGDEPTSSGPTFCRKA